MNNPVIGVPQYGGTKKKTWRLKDGSNIYRILPPFGSFAKDGRWAVYECIHWGYKGSKGIRTFVCGLVKDFKTKMVKTPCPECDLIEQRRKELDAQKHDLVEVKKTMTKEQANEFLKPLASWLFEHNLDKKWYLNVMNRNGEIGRLAIPHKMYQALQVEIQDLIKRGIDPIAANQGVEFDFNRSGSGNQTIHKCKAVVEMVDVPGMGKLERPKVVPLTEEIIGRMANEAWELGGMFRKLSFDEVQQLVSSGGDAEVVDRVFGGGSGEGEPSPEELAASTTSNIAEVVVAKAEVKTEAPAVNPADEIAALKAKLAALEQPKPEAPKVEVKSETKSTPTPGGMSNAEFMAKFGPKK